MVLNTGMSVKKQDEIWIYESPDGGETVYRRLQGGIHREIVKEPDRSILTRKLLWSKMGVTAVDDPELKELMEAAEVYYKLKYESV